MSKEKPLVTRIALFAPDSKSVSTQLPPIQEVVCTVRPGWSKIGAYELALPGGKIDPADYTGIEDREMATDIEAGARAAVREVWEELGIELAPIILQYILETTNDAGWTTLLYAAYLLEKPVLQVLPESAGSVWLDASAVSKGTIPLFAEHAYLVSQAFENFEKKADRIDPL